MALSAKDIRLIRVFAAIVLGRWEELAALRRAAPAGEPDLSWREAVLQSHLFAGFPRTVEAFEVLSRAGGLGNADADRAAIAADDGRALFDRIYGDLAGGVRERLSRFHPEFATWIADHAYARVLARPGLSADRRELLAVAALAVTQQQRQLMSHLRGAVRCGATAEEVSATLDAVADLMTAAEREALQPLVDRFAVREATP